MTQKPLNPRTTKAVIPAGGMGTRFLPATKAMPKEMLPVVDKPAIQYFVAEAKASGLDDVLMITGRSKRALEDHFDRVPALERTLELKGDLAKLEKIQEPTNMGSIHYVRQAEPRDWATPSCALSSMWAESPSPCSSETTSSTRQPTC